MLNRHLLEGKNNSELFALIDKIKVSDLNIKDKDALLKEIEYKLGLVKRDDVLKDIEDGRADIGDMEWLVIVNM